MARKPVTIYLVSRIQWVREQVEPFQRKRMKQVYLMDDLLESLILNPELPGFLLGGQTILLDDYLEVRSEQLSQIEALTQAGRLEVGPWYTLTEEFLVSPEALIRNLSFGTQTAEATGQDTRTGYLSPSTRHIGQLPQILAGFGINNATLTSNPDQLPSRFLWEAPNRSQILVDSMPSHMMDDDPHLTESNFVGQAKKANLPHLLVFTQNPDTALAKVKGAAIAQLQLGNYYENHQRGRRKKFPILSGEIHPQTRSPEQLGILSNRIWIKQRNHLLENLLERFVEPFGAWVTLLQGHSEMGLSANGDKNRLSSNAALTALAWRTLLKNHHQVSIAGTISDQVAFEISTRFDAAEQIASEVAEQNFNELARRINLSQFPDAAAMKQYLIVYNEHDRPRTDIAGVIIHIAEENHWPVKIVDSVGRDIPFDLFPLVDENGNFSGEASINLVATDVPPIGYQVYGIQYNDKLPIFPIADQETSIENEFFTVSVDPQHGTIDINDKRTGTTYQGLNQYISGGDKGDTYHYCPPKKDTLIGIASNTPLHIERQVGQAEQSLSYMQVYRLPASLTPDEEARLPLAAQFVPMSISTTVRLTAGVPRIDIVSQITNNAQDHRLQVHFPIDLDSDSAYFDGHFEIVERPIVPGQTYPQRAFVSVMEDDKGLTIANRGLPEVTLSKQKNEPIEIRLTLLRAVGWLSRDDQPGENPAENLVLQTTDTQSRGDYEFHYSIIPHASNEPLDAWAEAWQFQNNLEAQLIYNENGDQPLLNSFVECDNPKFILSSVKTAEDQQGLIVRGYNISQSAETVHLRLGVTFEQAQRVRLDETPIDAPINHDGDDWVFQAQPSEIVTIYFSQAGTVL